VTSINETVTTHFSGGPNITEEIEPPTVSANGNDVTLTWSSVEGGTYRLEATNDLATYSTVTTKAAATNATITSAAESGAAGANPKRFYRITRTALASYDAVSTTAAAATASGSAEPQALSTTSTAAEAPTATAVSTKKSRSVSRRTLRLQR
jgi:hypothetical protein